MVKRLLFRYGAWGAAVGTFLGVCVYGTRYVAGSAEKGDFSILITWLGAIGTVYFFIQKQKLDDGQVFHRLFREFNERFETLCIKLKEVQASTDDKTVLAQYLDLCAEEYYFRKQDMIYGEVWRTWCQGMLSFCENPGIRDFFEQQLKNPEDYYGLSMEAIRQGASTGNISR